MGDHYKGCSSDIIPMFIIWESLGHIPRMNKELTTKNKLFSTVVNKPLKVLILALKLCNSMTLSDLRLQGQYCHGGGESHWHRHLVDRSF